MERQSMTERAALTATLAVGLLTIHTLVNLRLLRRPSSVDQLDRDVRPSVSVLVPARNEAERIEACMASVLAQQGVDLELLVLDDGSTDGTAARARAVAGADPRVRVLSGTPLPQGWLGKPHACAQLAAHASGELLAFLDADVVLEPGALAMSADLVVASELDLVSPYPRQIATSRPARLFQPLLQWSWLTFLPVWLAERLRFPTLTAANGQLLVCRADTYRAAGGHAAVRDKVLEDMALARQFKDAGLKVALADGKDLAACAMYRSWEELRDGYTKSAWQAFGSGAGAAAAALLLAFLYLFPPAAAVAGLPLRRRRLVVIGASGYGLAVLGRVATALGSGGRPLDAAAHPASVGLLLWLLGDSFRRRRAGTLRWKDRPLP